MRAWMVALLALALATSGCTDLIETFQNPSQRGPGASYEAYLAGDANTLLVELDYAPGALWDPSTDAEEDFIAQLETITAKDVVVETSQDLPRKGPDYAYSIEELHQLAVDARDHENGNGTVVMHALFLDGEFGGSVAGVAYRAETFALFKGTIRDRTCSNDANPCNSPLQAVGSVVGQNSQSVREWKVTRSVAIHEAGHLFGLVDSPLPMTQDHEMEEDPQPDTEPHEGEAHSANPDSVMFWRVEVTGQEGLDGLIEGGDVPWQFDNNDLQDAQAVRDGSS